MDRGHPNTRSTTLSLPLTVTGINEYAPVFSTLTYTFFMDETERINSVIGIVTATDADDSSTSDGIFMYSFPGGALPFNLDSSSGEILFCWISFKFITQPYSLFVNFINMYSK